MVLRKIYVNRGKQTRVQKSLAGIEFLSSWERKYKEN